VHQEGDGVPFLETRQYARPDWFLPRAPRQFVRKSGEMGWAAWRAMLHIDGVSLDSDDEADAVEHGGGHFNRGERLCPIAIEEISGRFVEKFAAHMTNIFAVFGRLHQCAIDAHHALPGKT
jgi:hypothetical protein